MEENTITTSERAVAALRAQNALHLANLRPTTTAAQLGAIREQRNITLSHADRSAVLAAADKAEALAQEAGK